MLENTCKNCIFLDQYYFAGKFYNLYFHKLTRHGHTSQYLVAQDDESGKELLGWLDHARRYSTSEHEPLPPLGEAYKLAVDCGYIHPEARP